MTAPKTDWQMKANCCLSNDRIIVCSRTWEMCPLFPPAPDQVSEYSNIFHTHGFCIYISMHVNEHTHLL